MSEIPPSDVPAVLLHMVPETAPYISDMFEEPAGLAVTKEDTAVQLYELLLECFTEPLVTPQLESGDPDTDLMERCWNFVERVVDHSTQHVGGAVYFQVLEQLLREEGLLERAWPYMKEKTRARTLMMMDFFASRISGINR